MRSFGSRLVLLVVLMVGVFVGAVVWTGSRSYEHSREQLGQFHIQLARAMSTAVERELATAEAILSTLGTSPSLARNRLEEFHALASAVVAARPGAAISVFSSSGERILDTRVPFGAPLPDVPIADSTSTGGGMPRSAAGGLRRALESGRTSVSDLFLDLVTGRPAVALHLPLEKSDERYVLSLVMTPAVFQELLAAQRLPASAGANLSDGQGRTIARTASERPFLGEPVAPDLMRAGAAAREGFREGRTREGREVLFAHSRSLLSGWTAAVGVSRPVAFAAIRESMTQLVAAAIVLLVLGILLAAWLARSVARPLDQLTAAAEAIERGAPVSLNEMRGEFSRLASALCSLDRAIREREHERSLRAQAEAQRVAAEQASEAKDRFLALLSHELRNPLTAVANCATLLKRATGEDHARVLAILARQAAQLRMLVEDLLELARITHGKLRMRIQPVDLSEIANGVAAAYWARGREILVHAPAAIWVAADPDRLAQIVGNLVENAVRYGGEKIVLETRADEQCGLIAVEDNGRGIPGDMLPHLFEDFMQGRDGDSRQGLGLGLALVHKLTTMHGGEVSVEAGSEGRRNRFAVRLPLTAARPPRSAHQASVDVPKRRILVIDDEPDLRQTTCRLLEMEGHEVAAAADAAEGLRKVAQFRPDVAFVDLRLDDMSGYDFARKARELPEGQAVTLVALTGYDQPEVRDEAREAGFDLHLTKPAGPDAMRQALTHDRTVAGTS